MKKGAFYILLCYVCWGVLPIFWKTLAELDPLYVLATRISWSLVLTAILLTASREWAGARAVLRDKREWLLLTQAGVLIGINWGVYIWAVNSGHMIDSSLAYYIMNPLAALAGTLVFHEKLTKLQWFSAGLTVTGIVIAAVQFRVFPWIALVVGGSFALYGVVKKKVGTTANVSMFVETATLIPLALSYVIIAEARGAGALGILHGAQWILLPLSGIVTTVPLLLFAKGIKTTPMSLSGVLVYINPTLQLLIGVLLYKEAFTSTHAMLFGFVWTGLALYLISGWMEQKKSAKEEKPCV